MEKSLVLANNIASFFSQAISSYSKANSIKPLDPIVLGNRSAAYIRYGFTKPMPSFLLPMELSCCFDIRLHWIV
jgi:methyltransferase-like protein